MSGRVLSGRSHFGVAVCVLWLAVCCCEEVAEAADVAAPMAEAEKAALFYAIQGFVGDWWNGSDLYPDPCGWTSIQGVSCDIFDGLWYVTSLTIGSIHENSLACMENADFRTQFFELKHLKSLTFVNCFSSSHKHPVYIQRLNWLALTGCLESLEFRSNPGLIGNIPDSFGSLIKLQSLVLLKNGISGQIPPSLESLVKLKRLVLSENWLTGQVPEIFGGYSELLILDLSRNSLSGPLSKSLKNLSSLLKLDVSNNQLGGSVPGEISNLKNLTLLDLGNNKFSGGLRKSLLKLQSLVEMVVSNNPLGRDMTGLRWQNMQSLEILVLSNVGLAGEIPETVSELKKLRFLGLSNNNLTGNPPLKLATLSDLSAVYLDGNNLTGVLQFPEEFYKKLRRRFGAWNNPNLCFPGGSMETYVPYGVKKCHGEVGLVEANFRAKSDDGNGKQEELGSNPIASHGSLNGGHGVWFVVLLNIAMMLLWVHF